jgi:hypothetical protein
MIIICKDSPEWGTWRIIEDTGEWYVIRGRSGVKVLHYGEFKRFWEIVK